MSFLIAGMICVLMALINLPSTLNGSVVNLCSMIFCGILALFNLIMAIKTSRR